MVDIFVVEYSPSPVPPAAEPMNHQENKAFHPPITVICHVTHTNV